MSSETRLAFEHPEARSEAHGQPAAPPDRISLRDHVVEAEIGAFQQERGTTQRLRFNIVVEVAAPEGPVADDVDKILSYDTITESIAFELAAERLNLLETLAERVADRIRAALHHVPAERLVVAPDCGMKYLPRDIAFAKLKAMAEGAALVRAEIMG